MNWSQLNDQSIFQTLLTGEFCCVDLSGSLLGWQTGKGNILLNYIYQSTNKLLQLEVTYQKDTMYIYGT